MIATSVPIPESETKGKPEGSLSSRRDPLLKRLIETFFGDLLRLVTPELEAMLNLDRIEFRYTGFPPRSQRTLDLFAEVERRDGKPSILVELKLGPRAQRSLTDRLWLTYIQILLGQDRLVLPVLVNLEGGPAGVTWQTYVVEGVDGEETVRFRYCCFGVSGCLAEEYLAKPVPLAWGLAALMPSQKWNRGEQKLECLRRISSAPALDEVQTALLVECVDTFFQAPKTIRRTGD